MDRDFILRKDDIAELLRIIPEFDKWEGHPA